MTLHETVDITDKNNNKTIGKWGGGGVGKYL